MSDSPEQIRAEIEQTRRELGTDVDALADKVSPSKIVDRQVDKVKGAFGSMRERIMGSDDDHDDNGSVRVGADSPSVGERVGEAKDRVVAKAEGSPLAVGLIAFGVGLVLASLFPASRKEKSLAADVKEQAQPLMQKAADVAKEMGEHLKEPAQEAVAAVTDSARESVDAVKDQTQTATHEVRDQVQQSRDAVTDS